jgi:hypothetical protein
MEPNWTKNIPSSTVCNFFYMFFVVYAVIFVVSVLMTLGIMTSTKLKGALGIALGAQAILTTLIGGTMMLFYYLVCDRALLSKKTQNEGFFAETDTTVPPAPIAALPCAVGKTRNAHGICE